MQITKIISGGQTGADQAALDAAIELGIDHGGWVPKGRLTEDGPLADKYRLTETRTASYPERTERNVLDGDGTVIFSHGPLTGGSKLTAELAQKHGKPCLHIDLGRMHPLKASGKLHKWIRGNGVRILNVAGAKASKDPAIYNEVYQAIWGLFVLDTLGADPGPEAEVFRLDDLSQKISNRPETVAAAVEFLEKHLPLAHRVEISRMGRDELAEAYPGLGAWMREIFGLWQGNDALLKNIEEMLGHPIESADEATSAILAALAQRLRRTHRLRVVK
ncbi:MAG TPA: hypothetical protein ENF48_04475 [Desulfobacteraceae bacterium]|nr:putative molybdenum carrier protein [Deltaproteobacteria bacterium]HDI59605.1 hypothetical protein [Desulfobacteraceae bacterium]